MHWRYMEESMRFQLARPSSFSTKIFARRSDREVRSARLPYREKQGKGAMETRLGDSQRGANHTRVGSLELL
ncbi:MAG: hypothetical protein P4M11_07240 [Candidatus Pacebacteria bacterium]|nr:hypothetical protein [Candidatus Paceibacterota bacterium]